MRRILKVTSATCLLEVQTILHVEGLALKVDYVNSAGAWRATLQHHDSHGELWTGVGRSIGEALEGALKKFEEKS